MAPLWEFSLSLSLAGECCFTGVAAASAVTLALLVPDGRIPGSAAGRQRTPAAVLKGFIGACSSARGLRAHGYVFANGIFHSGIYTGLGIAASAAVLLTAPAPLIVAGGRSYYSFFRSATT